MPKKILIPLFLLILLLIGVGFFGYNNYQSQRIQNNYLASKLTLLNTVFQNTQAQFEAEAKRGKNYHDILMQSGTLHAINLGISTGETASGLITDPFDIVRFINSRHDPVSLDIYDTPAMSGKSLMHADILPDDFVIFPLKKSGFYYYRSGDLTGMIQVGKSADMMSENFLRLQIFPLIQKSDPNSLDAALIKFKEAISSSPEISKKCHDYAHEIGHEAFDIFGFAVSIAHAGTDICAGGYTHGILEHYFASDTRLGETPERACDGIDEKKRGSCFHGVGHGLMFLYGDDITKSLEKCETLGDKKWKNRCAEGVFMELYAGDPRHAGGQVKYDINDLFAPCAASHTGSAGYVCGFYSGLGYLRYHDEDYSGALSACKAGGGYARMCITGVGREVAKRYLGDALRLEHLCGDLAGEDQLACVTGGVNYTALQYEDDPSIISQYCTRLHTDTQTCENSLHKNQIVTQTGSADTEDISTQ